ncbi:MAG TPA: hypothetical protein VEK07_01210 [Polyangiaceae bacterium]|nr:hypothetical protein [Polyangiaceae bacterium]
MSHIGEYDAKFLKALAEIDGQHAEQVRRDGCPECGGVLDRADYPRKPRGELGEAGGDYERRRSFCCRVDGCRKRATPASLRFFGRKVYFAVLVIVASARARSMSLTGRDRPRRVHGVPLRTVCRWLQWWQGVFALGSFWSAAKGFFAKPVEEGQLPASLLERFGSGGVAIEKLLRFTAPITTTSVVTRIAMAG